jgi:hypothetical protein
VLLAVMVLPTIVSLSDDALRTVPAAQRSAARGLGLTRAETVLAVFCRRRGADSERLFCLAFGVRSVRRSPFSSSSGDRIINCRRRGFPRVR